jgi:hypothetical protein
VLGGALASFLGLTLGRICGLQRGVGANNLSTERFSFLACAHKLHDGLRVFGERKGKSRGLARAIQARLALVDRFALASGRGRLGRLVNNFNAIAFGATDCAAATVICLIVCARDEKTR